MAMQEYPDGEISAEGSSAPSTVEQKHTRLRNILKHQSMQTLRKLVGAMNRYKKAAASSLTAADLGGILRAEISSAERIDSIHRRGAYIYGRPLR